MDLGVSKIISLNKVSHTIDDPIIILKKRNFDVIGEIPFFFNWRLSFKGMDKDEIFFEVYKELNGIKCPVWDKINDLAIIEVRGYGHFEISVSLDEQSESIKSVIGQSLEVELGQAMLYDLHINDDDATTMEQTEYNNEDFDEYGNFIPTVFYNESDPKHSLLHRVLADKAPHWSIGHVPLYIATTNTIAGNTKPEPVSSFQRTYTADGTSIYDFLMGDVAEETNVIFIFDTYKRTINCYNAEDYVWTDGTDTITIVGYGEDTTILVDRDNIANQLTISGDVDSVKNCFKVSGGDDVVTSYLRAANVTGTDYIWCFSQPQLDDMPTELVEKLNSYNKLVKASKEEYVGENGIFTKLCKAYDNYSYYESELMPNVSLEETTASDEYTKVIAGFNSMQVGVYSYDNFNNNLFVGITNNVVAMAQICVDARYEVEAVEGSTSYNSATHKWTGKLKVYRKSDETDSYTSSTAITLPITENELEYTRQKIQRKLAECSVVDFEFDTAHVASETTRLTKYFMDNYCRVQLKSIYDGYESCVSILSDLMSKNDSIVAKELSTKYVTIRNIAQKCLKDREAQVSAYREEIDDLTAQQEEFQANLNFEKYLGADLFKVFCMYRRDGEYSNENYISDGKSDSEILQIAQELLQVAEQEIKKACVLQLSITTDLNNLLAIPAFEPLYDSFSLYNYIRVWVDDKLYKLRLFAIDYDSSSPDKIQVTFADNIKCVDGNITELQNMYKSVTSIASSYSATMRQAESGEKAKNEVANLMNNGLNAALMQVKNSKNNEVTLGDYGLLCREMTDDGIYSDKQLRLIGKGLYITDDNWQSLRACIGETTDNNYGVIADTLIGNLIAGNKLIISNDSGTVKITGDGINIEGGYLKLEKNDCSVEIDPMQLKDPNNQKIMSIDANGDNIFHINRNGDGYFKGKIEAADGTFSGELKAATGTFSGSLSSQSIQLNPNSQTNNKGLIRLTNLEETDTGDRYKVVDLCNDYASSSDLVGVTLSVRNTGETSYYATTGMGVYKKNGSIFNKLYGNTYLTGKLLFGNGSNGFGYLSDTNDPYCIGRFGVGGVPNINYTLNVNGIARITDRLDIGDTNYGSSLNVKGDILCHSTDTYNAAHMIVQNSSHKGALAVNEKDFGLWDFTYNKWMIRVKEDGTVTVASTMSDKNLKKNIKDTSVNNALDQILAINHKEFDFIQGNSHKDIGYIAQELEEINPLMVNKPDSEDDVYTVDSFYMESLITKAIQEMSEKYDNEIAELKKEIRELRNKVENK